MRASRHSYDHGAGLGPEPAARDPAESIRMLKLENLVLLERLERDSQTHENSLLEFKERHLQDTRALQAEADGLRLRLAETEQTLLRERGAAMALRAGLQDARAVASSKEQDSLEHARAVRDFEVCLAT